MLASSSSVCSALHCMQSSMSQFLSWCLAIASTVHCYSATICRLSTCDSMMTRSAFPDPQPSGQKKCALGHHLTAHPVLTYWKRYTQIVTSSCFSALFLFALYSWLVWWSTHSNAHVRYALYCGLVTFISSRAVKKFFDRPWHGKWTG